MDGGPVDQALSLVGPAPPLGLRVSALEGTGGPEEHLELRAPASDRGRGGIPSHRTSARGTPDEGRLLCCRSSLLETRWVIRMTPSARHSMTTPTAVGSSVRTIASSGSPSGARVLGTNPHSKGYLTPKTSGRE